MSDSQGIDTQQLRAVSAYRQQILTEAFDTLRWLQQKQTAFILVIALILIATTAILIVNLAPLWIVSDANTQSTGALGAAFVGQYIYSQAAFTAVLGGSVSILLTIFAAVNRVEIRQMKNLITVVMLGQEQ